MSGGVINFILRCFKKGSGAEEVTKDLKDAKGAAQDLSKGLSALGGTANVVGRAVKAIATGGLWELGGVALDYIIDKYKEWKEAAAKAAREAAKEIKDNLAHAAEFIEARFKRISDAISATASRAKELLGLEGKRGEARTASATAGINAEMRKELSGAKDDSERAVIQARAQTKIAKVNAEERVKRAEAARAEAEEEMHRAYRRIEAAKAALLEAQNNVGKANVAHRNAMKAEDDEAIKTAGAAQYAAGKKRDEAQKRLDDEMVKWESARIAELAASAELEKTRTEAGESVAAADFALAEATRKQKEAAEAKAEAERKAAEKLNAERAEMGRQFVEQYEASQKEARKKEAEERLAEEQKKAKEQQKKIGDTIQRLLREILDIEKDRERTRKGMETDHKNHNGLFGPYQYGLDENGNISNFTDWNRADRYAGHDNDEQKSKRRAESDDKRMENLWWDMQQGKYVSEADQNKVNRWRQFKKERDGEEKRKAQIEALKDKQQQAVINSEKHLEQIKNDMKSFIENGCVQ